jgi:hypothetical protein
MRLMTLRALGLGALNVCGSLRKGAHSGCACSARTGEDPIDGTRLL